MNRRTMLLGSIGAAVGAALPGVAMPEYDRVTARGNASVFKRKIDVVMWNGRAWVKCGYVDFDHLVPGGVIDISNNGTSMQSWSAKIR